MSSAVFLVARGSDGQWKQKACAPGAYSACLRLPCRVLSAVALLRTDTLGCFAWLTVECLLCICAVYTNALVLAYMSHVCFFISFFLVLPHYFRSLGGHKQQAEDQFQMSSKAAPPQTRGAQKLSLGASFKIIFIYGA